MLSLRKLEITAGFLLLTAGLLYLDRQNLFLTACAACLFHEGGHLLALRILGGRVRKVRLSCCGAAIYASRDRTLSYREQFLIVQAGPAASLLLFCVSLRLGRNALAGISAAQAAFNLLPVLPLDGGRALLAVLSGLTERQRAERICQWFSVAFSVLLFGVGLWVAVEKKSSLLLPVLAIWMLAGNLDQRDVAML